MASQVPCDHDHLGFCGPGEPVAGRWPFGEFRVKLSRLDIQPGLLPQLYRCYVIYGMNYWAIAFPFVIYLASWGMCSNSLQIKGGTRD